MVVKWVASSKNKPSEHARTATAQIRQSDQAFAVRCQSPWILWSVSMQSQDPDKTLVNAQDDVNPHILHMLEDTFSHGLAQMKI